MEETGRGGGPFGRDNCYELNDITEISMHTLSLIHCDIPMYSLVFFCICMVKWILILMLQIEKRFFYKNRTTAHTKALAILRLRSSLKSIKQASMFPEACFHFTNHRCVTECKMIVVSYVKL